ncbi:MAG: beta strand repeat-containing protein, partial [Tepidisphaeraceae bacterium]
MNFTGTNAFTGSLYYDSGTVNFSGDTTMAAIHLRSPIVNITGSLTTNGGYDSLGQDSFTTNGGPDKAVVNISGNGSFTQTTGDDFNISDNANTEGTINISDNGALVTGGITALGKSAGAKGTINQNGGTVTINRGGNFALVLGDRNGTGYYNLNAGTLTSAGEMYVGEGGSGVGYYTQTGGSATVKNWFVIGRESAMGTFDQSGGTFTHSNGGNISIGEGNNTKLNSMTVRGNSVFKDQVGEFWVGNIGGNGTLNIQDTASLTVNDWLAVGRASGASIGVLNLSGGTLTKQGNNFLAIGSGGTGTLNQTGGTLTSTGTRIGEASNGTANLSGGSATFTGEFSLGYSNNVVGTLNISNSANVTVPDVVFGVTGTGTGGGAINLNGGTLTGSSFTAGATSTGSRTVTFNGGTLRPSADSTNFIGAKITGIVSTGGANIDTNAHAITVNGALTHDATLSGADGGLTVTGGGTLTLAGVNTYNGATAVNSGSLAVTSTGVINTSTLNSATAISNNGVITTNAGGSINSITGTGTLNVAGGTLALSNPTLGTINSQSAINFSGNGVLDIHKNQIQVSGNQYAALAANYVAGQLKSSDAQLNASSRSVGIAYNGSSTTTARYTTYGDTNLDGKFNGTDIVAINGANNFGGPVGSAIWATGDTNYDGKFNGIDVAKINGANSFGTGVITNASPSPAMAVVSSIAPNGGDTSKIDLQYDAATGNLRVVTNGNPYGTITLSASSSVFKDGVFGTSPEFYSDDNGDGTSLFFGVLTGQQTADVLLPGVLDTNLSTSTLLSAITVAGVTNGPSPAN